MGRLDTPDKNWKFSTFDVKERQFWDEYQEAYEDMIRHTASEHAPWYVVPADNKWFTRLAVAAVLYNTMKNLNLTYPTVSEQQKQALFVAMDELEREDGGLRDKAILKAEAKAAAYSQAPAASSAVTKDEAKKKGRKKGKKKNK